MTGARDTSRATATLTPEQVLAAYTQGYFPMATGPHGVVEFMAFEPRGVIPLDDRFTVRRSLRQVLRKEQYRFTRDAAFRAVIEACSRHGRVPAWEVWLSSEMIEVYVELHRRGVAHSVEVWEDEELVGGLYGLTIGGAFCGESMFSRRPNASQLALVRLVEHLRARGFTLLDAQMSSEHLMQFGLFELSHEEYLAMLNDAMQRVVTF